MNRLADTDPAHSADESDEAELASAHCSVLSRGLLTLVTMALGVPRVRITAHRSQSLVNHT
jgi:hypothetical protein